MPLPTIFEVFSSVSVVLLLPPPLVQVFHLEQACFLGLFAQVRGAKILYNTFGIFNCFIRVSVARQVCLSCAPVPLLPCLYSFESM
jgi:hypothetical protein